MAAVLGRHADWSPKLGTFGEIVEGPEDVAQCLAILLQTPKGSSPLRPLFGCDAWRYVDQPLAIAKPKVVGEVLEAIALWEPRASVHQVRVDALPLPASGLRLRLGLWAYGLPLTLELPFYSMPDRTAGQGYVQPGYVSFGYVTGTP